MGHFRFTVSDTSGVDPRVWQTAYITGIEGVPWHCRHTIENDQFIIGREIGESGKLNIVWPTRSAGNVCLSTCSLREGDHPYNLAVEIARGTVGRLKTQTADWQRIGLKPPEGFFTLAEKSLHALLRSLTQTRDPREQESLAQSSIEHAVEASAILCQTFARQALASRRQTDGPLTTLLGITLPEQLGTSNLPSSLADAATLVTIQPDLGSVEQSSGKSSYELFDAQLDWAERMLMKICIGPLVDFRPGRFPKWMILLDEDYKSILNAACKHAEQTVGRYRGRTHLWNCAAGLNSPNSFRWSDDEVLRMAVAIISTVRQTDNRTPVVLTVEQPWGEYLRDHAGGISPLHFADALIRADLGISGLSLELNFDVWPGGSFPRDLTEVNRLIDRWSMLGLPLLVSLSSPTERVIDESARCVSHWPIGHRHQSSQEVKDREVGDGSTGRISPETLVQLLLSKPSVHAVVWEQLSDQIPRATSSSGLLDNAGKPKQLLREFADLRKRFL